MTGKLFKKAAVLAVFAAAAGCAAAFPGVDAHSSESRDAAQSLYEVIAAEIAAHREQPEVALALLDQTLARTKSSEVGELAWRTALQTRNPDIVLEQARAGPRSIRKLALPGARFSSTPSKRAVSPNTSSCFPACTQTRRTRPS